MKMLNLVFIIILGGGIVYAIAEGAYIVAGFLWLAAIVSTLNLFAHREAE